MSERGPQPDRLHLGEVPRTSSVPKPRFLKFALTRSIRPLFFMIASASFVVMRCRQSLIVCGSRSRSLCLTSNCAGLTSVAILGRVNVDADRRIWPTAKGYNVVNLRKTGVCQPPCLIGRPSRLFVLLRT